MVQRLTEEKKNKIKHILEKLTQEKIYSLIEQQIYVLNAKLADVCNLRELDSLKPHITTVKLMVLFAQRAKDYALSLDLSISHEIQASLTNQTQKFALLETAQEKLIETLKQKEREHEDYVHSPRMMSADVTIFRSRTVAEHEVFLKELELLEKSGEKIQKSMAKISTDLYNQKIILSIFEAQLNDLEKADYSFYSDGIEKLLLQKNKADLNGFVDAFRGWQKVNREDLAGIRASNELIDSISRIIYNIKKVIAAYPVLAEAEKEINRFIQHSLTCDPRIDSLVNMLKFEEKCDKLHHLHLEKLHISLPTRGHLRQRSKSNSEASQVTQSSITFFQKKWTEQRKSTQIKRHQYKRSNTQGKLIFAHARLNNENATKEATTESQAPSPAQ